MIPSAARWGLLLLLLALIGAPSTAGAQGKAEEVLRQRAGPYQVAVAVSSAQPVAGPLYLWVTLTDAATGQPITDAQIGIHAQRSVDATGESALALHSPQAPGTYVADITLDQPGAWLLSFSISDPLGEATATLNLEVGEDIENAGVGTLGFAVVVAILGLGGTYLWWVSRKALRARRPMAS